MTPSRPTRWLAAAALAAALAGCQSADPSEALTVTDPWAKAADSGMTAAFGTLVNHTDQAITVVSAECELSPMELHEMAMADDGSMVMRPKEGGLVVPADGSAELAPGGDHLMLMDLADALEPGAEVEITLVGDDGTRWTFTAAARSFDGAQEEYVGDDGAMGEMSEPTEP